MGDEGAAENHRQGVIASEDEARSSVIELQVTQLHEACMEGQLSVVESLLKEGVSVNAPDADEWTALHWSSSRGEIDIVRYVLELGADKNMNVNVNAVDKWGQTALHLAASNGYDDIVETLLDKGSDVKSQDIHGQTALHLAASNNHDDIVKILLEKIPDMNVNAMDEWGQTAMHLAASNGYNDVIKILLEKGSDMKVNSVDQWGQTALHLAVSKDYNDIVKTLLNKGAQVKIPDKYKRTPLSVAINQNSLEGVKILLENLYAKDPPDSTVYGQILSFSASQAREPASEPSNQPASQPSNELPIALSWASEDRGRHLLAKILLFGQYHNDQPDWRQSAIVWAAVQERPGVLWWLIATSPHDFETKNSVTEARMRLEHKRLPARGKRMETAKTTDVKNEAEVKNVAGEKTKNLLQDMLDPLQDVLDILRNPPFAQFYQDKTSWELPKLSASAGKYSALIAGFFKDKDKKVFSTIRRQRTVEETVYSIGPAKIMKEAAQRETQRMAHHHRQTNETFRPSINSEIYSNSNHEFTWIHLPATNMQWMEYLLNKIAHNDSAIGADYDKLKSFLKDTWFEIPDRQSNSRIMRPQFVERKLTPRGKQDKRSQKDVVEGIRQEQSAAKNHQEKESQKSHEQGSDNEEIASSAVYMPFLSFSTHFQKYPLPEGSTQVTQPSQYGADVLIRLEEARKRYLDLMRKCNNGSISDDCPVIHGCPTLDEAYYHFAEDKVSKDDQEYRNRNQVVTKQLNNENPRNQAPNQRLLESEVKVESLPILRVNQIWIWTIANKWLISAASHPVDDVEQLWVDGFFNHLNKAAEAGGTQCRPSSTEEMMKEIVNYCIGSYERRREHRKLSLENGENNGQRNSDWEKPGLSIRQLVSNYINDIGRKETDLFDRIRNSSKTGDAKKKTATDKKRREKAIKEAINTAVELFGEVKDVRDELDILQWIATYQRSVQKKLFKKDVPEPDLIASHVLKDISLMEQRASRIQEAANSTLSLQQGTIANIEADESMKQSSALAVFTVCTVIFTPMSFLTSLFSMDGNALTWGVTFGAGVVFTLILSILAWYLCLKDHSDTKSKNGKSDEKSDEKVSPKSVEVESRSTTFGAERPLSQRRSRPLDIEKGEAGGHSNWFDSGSKFLGYVERS